MSVLSSVILCLRWSGGSVRFSVERIDPAEVGQKGASREAKSDTVLTFGPTVADLRGPGRPSGRRLVSRKLGGNFERNVAHGDEFFSGQRTSICARA